ncbi:MAG: response regulator transcription factor [Planctomycetota bacterium]|jgi:two-component system OmpR family response regulator
MKKILIIEDEPEIVDLVRAILDDYNGYSVSSADSGEQGLQLIMSERPDLVLLDLNLPVMNGIEVLRRIRKIDENLPIFIVSSRSEELDRVLGLELGADDYITKPFFTRELRARIDSFFRRWDADKMVLLESPVTESDEEIVRGVLKLAVVSMQAIVNGKPVGISRKEFEILKLLAGSPGKVFSREAIIKTVWGDKQGILDRNIDTHIKRIRAKLKKVTGESEWLETVRGVGYRFTNYYDRFTGIPGE